MTSAQIVARATEPLATFNRAGVLAAADVHVALRLQSLGGEPSADVLLAAALAVRAARLGSVCVDLRRFTDVSVDEEFDVDLPALPWPALADVLQALRASPLVAGAGAGPLHPLRLVDTDAGELLYLDRYFRQELTIRTVLDARALTRPHVDRARLASSLDALFGDPSDPAVPGAAPGAAPDRQRVAAALAATQWTTVISGGPGTGKTYTVARILALLFEQHGPSLRVALAAPTGKAAARLAETVNEQAAGLGLPAGLTAMTLHRLLGWQRGSRSRFRHDENNHLPYDVVVVDETSMVSLTMMARLLAAVRPQARLLLIGDPDQLASVDAGAVLADLVARPVTAAEDPVFSALVAPDLAVSNDPGEAAFSPAEIGRLPGGLIRLSRGRRFGGAIARLAVAVRDGRSDAVLALLRSGEADVSFHAPDDVAALRADVVASARAVTEAATAGDVAGALALLEVHRLLCAHREGPFGVRRWAQQAMDWIGTATGRPVDPSDWFPGQPLLATVNDYELKVYNGDTGVIVQRPGGDLVAAFARGSDPILLHPSRLSDVQTVYAMTIHRSQGSQYDTVSVLLPAEASSLLTRELLYTAITRARRHVRVIGTEESVRAGVDRQVLRASGLRRTFR